MTFHALDKLYARAGDSRGPVQPRVAFIPKNLMRFIFQMVYDANHDISDINNCVDAYNVIDIIFFLIIV